MKKEFDELSFILGLFAADGNLDKSRVRFFCSEEEFEFFNDKVQKMIVRLFKVKPTIRHDIKKNYVLSINSVIIEKWFRSVFNYSGKKKDNLKIPKMNLNENSFISGLVAGDGCIVISKNN